ncbi:MAG: hypothetical protein ACRDNE_00255 [Gaiellaceae bacterium]
MSSFVASALVALTATGCGTFEQAATSGDPRACEAPAGSVTDVAHEPDWRRFADYQPWTTVDGCLVRIDVLADRPGPEHCGFESAR